MKVCQHTLHFLLSLLMTSYCRFSRAKRCTSNGHCQFLEECVDGFCRCENNCDKFGKNFICGEDGNYYKNECFLRRESCMRKTHLQVVSFGRHRHCMDHHLHNSISNMSKDLPCRYRDRYYCLNSGICKRSRRGSKSCLCLPQFSGPRCQDRSERVFIKYTERKRKSRFLIQNPLPYEKQKREFQIVPVLVLCFFSALCSAIITSALCHRINLRRIRLMAKDRCKEKTKEKLSKDKFSNAEDRQFKNDGIIEMRV